MDEKHELTESPGRAGATVFRNAGFLMAAQMIMLPMSIVIQAVMGRYLGPTDLGRIYLVTTYTSLGILIGSWGQSGTLPANVAREPDRVGDFLGSALAFQVVSAIAIVPGLFAFSHWMQEPTPVQVALAIGYLGALVASLSSAYLEVARGLERSDVTARFQVGAQILNTVVVIPALMLGGRVNAVLAVQALNATIMVFFISRRVKTLWKGRLKVRWPLIKSFAEQGTPFLLLGLALAAQPSIDAAFLSRLAPEEAVGWYAVSRRLVGVLVLPASTIASALYPSLCRAWIDDRNEYLASIQAAIKVAAMFVVPAAFGCAFYPDIGVSLFNRTTFRPAEDNLVVLAVFLPLVYITMIIGTAVVAANGQRRWAVLQTVCIAVSFALDPLLIPWFQEHYGNGGLGLCCSMVASEILMLIGGIWLMERGALVGTLSGQVRRCLIAGVAMAAVGFTTRRFLGAFGSAPVAVVTYFGVLWAVGGLNKSQLALAGGMLRKR